MTPSTVAHCSLLVAGEKHTSVFSVVKVEVKVALNMGKWGEIGAIR